MALNVSRVDVWAASIEDKPGGLSGKLKTLADAGAQLEFAVARRAPDKPGAGVVFLTPLKGARKPGQPKKAGFEKTSSLHSLRIEAEDKPGLASEMATALAEAGINLRGLSAAAIGGRCVVYLALDDAADATKAAKVLKRL